jgi:repressor LexA
MRLELTNAQQSVLTFLENRQECGDPPPTVREICEHFGYGSTRSAADHLDALKKKGVVTREHKSARGLRLTRPTAGIPLLGQIPAGHARSVDAEVEQRLPLNPEPYGIRDRARAFALRVSGDSMIGRHLFDGDIVILESGAEPKHGDIVAALIDNESTLKTLVLKNGKAWLHAENPKYPDITPAWDLHIQGVARAVIRLLDR